ncbi:MAG TPA: class I SAM-dependent methyltransferase [Sedimenticola sp.]|nr:class I SAM-dependent methyltransferase [Sedimenticola sp.]
MKEVRQYDSDKLWSYYQNQARESFDSSYSRLQFISKRCRQGASVLNIGAGSGYLESLLMQRGVIAYSLDPSELTVKRLNEEQGMAGRARQGYCHAIPFSDGFFDIVIMTEVLEHIQEDLLDASLREVGRVLKGGGLFIGTVPYREALRDNEVFCPHCQARFHRWGHLHSFDLNALKHLLHRNEMVVEKLYTRSFPDFSRPGVRLFLRAFFRYVLGRMGEALVAPNIYFEARTALKPERG